MVILYKAFCLKLFQVNFGIKGCPIYLYAHEYDEPCVQYINYFLLWVEYLSVTWRNFKCAPELMTFFDKRREREACLLADKHSFTLRYYVCVR